MLNIIDLETQFSKQKINKAKKLSLREIEEDKKNHFICFVDEGEESYDAQISISEKLEIIDSSCDCSEKGFCNHLLALAIHISEIKNNKPTKKAKAKKISEAELAIENLNSEEIKGWILEFFKKNKEAEIQFLLEFGEKKTDFSDHEIKSIIDKSIQSVVGKKKNITAPEIKKIVDILTKSLEPVEEFMWQNITKNIALETYNLICDHLLSFQMNIYTTSNRIESFIDKFRTKFAINFNQIKDQSVWEILAQEYWNYYLKGTGSIPYTLYHLLFDIYKYADIPQKKFIANASCTTNCLGPIAKIIDDAFGIEKGLMTTIHSYTNDQNILDVKHKSDKRRARAGAANMIPTSTGAAKAMKLIMPQLDGKLHGQSVRVPTPNVSMVDVNFLIKKDTTKEEINALFTQKSKELSGIVAVDNDMLVSSDLIGNTNSTIIASDLTQVIGGNMIKVMSWYDNEWGYSARLVDLAIYVAKK
jgi:hypothetical protein